MTRVLFVDDDVDAHKNLSMVLGDEFHLVSAYSGEMGVTRAAETDPDVILLDIEMDGMSGIDVLERLPRGGPPVVMLTAHDEVGLVVQAMRGGAFDYLTKDYDLEQLEGALRRAARSGAARAAASASVFSPSAGADALGRITGSSPAMREIRRILPRYASVDATVCIQGESGTGKELVAAAIHGLSHRSSSAFVAVNCGALPESVLETELFGSERGAYTDAVSRAGKFEQAGEGSIFLDEIGELSLAAQARMLRVLEQRRVTRVGGEKEIHVDVRVIAATNKDLPQEVEAGRFREDLFYRVAVLPLEIPPLRKRVEDIPLLARCLLAELDPTGELTLEADALDEMCNHQWPGNVRELRNVIQRAVVLCEGSQISAADVDI